MTLCRKNIFLASLLVILTTFSTKAQVIPGLGNLPLYFEGQGSQNEPSQFLARSRDGQVLISPAEVQINLQNDATVKMQLIGASPRAQIHGEAELAGKINYLTGNDPAHWRTGLTTFAKVGVDNLYPGIDAIYYGDDRELEYDFNIAPGAKPGMINLRFNGARKLSVNALGQLVLSVGHGEIYEHKPLIYQLVAGARKEIVGGYKILDSQTVGFALGAYDARLPLVIDPILTYSSYLGGNNAEVAFAVVVHTNDSSFFIAGRTLAKNFATPGSFQTNVQGGTYYGDAFVAKFGQTGTNLIYLTYLGGSAEDAAAALAVDSAGNAFVAGYTASPNFPVTTVTHPIWGVSTNIGGTIIYGAYSWDAFVAELNSTGSGLIYSTYLGGSRDDIAVGVAIDGSDNAYVTGYTFSTNFPVTNAVSFTLIGSTNHLLNTPACTNTYAINCNAFIAKIHAGGSNLDYSTYFGGNNYDIGTGIAVDNANFVYVTGFTSSTNFPTTNAFNTILNASNYVEYVSDAFVSKFASSGTNLNLLYSTYLGSTNDDEANGLALDGHGGVYVTGYTTSPGFTNTTIITNVVGVVTNHVPGIIGNSLSNNIFGILYTTNVFLTKITNNAANMPGIAYSVVFGGSVLDVGYGVAVDPAGNAFVTGSTTSPTFPTNNTFGLLGSVLNGYNDAFVTAFNANCTKVLYSVFLGGAADDFGYAIAVDNNSTAYVVGQTYSANFPVTTASTNFMNFAPNTQIYSARATNLYSTVQYSYDAFVARVLTNNLPSFSFFKAGKKSLSVFYPNVAGYFLQSNTNLSGANWVSVPNTPAINNGFDFLTFSATNPAQFFRLVY